MVGPIVLFVGQRGIDAVHGHGAFLSLHRSNGLLMEGYLSGIARMSSGFYGHPHP
jgi:hypothetical protein